MSIRLCNNAKTGLKLNESLSTGGRYILQGVFAELGVMNVNRRIYTEEEYLKHLQYLREDVQKGDLLGELDHPEDRFEVRMKEVSHRVIDIWYDPSTKMVMGKIELLNTPNGLVAKEVVDAGIPLHISSRAAGTINKDNTVSIQQIYTYDIVAKPGFAKATLHRVNESQSSEYSDNVKNFLKKSEEMESTNQCVSLGIVNENESAFVDTLKKSAVLRKEAIEINEGKSKAIDMAVLTTHINEEDEQNKAALEAGVSTPSMDPNAGGASDTDTSSKDDTTDDKSKEEGDNKEEKKDPFKIVKAEAIKADEKDDDSEKDDKDDKSDDDKEGDEKKEDGDNEDNKEQNTDECAGSDCKGKDCKKDSKLFDDIKSNIEEKQSSFLSKFEEIKNGLKKKKEVNESLKSQLATEYPFSQYLNESDLMDFSALTVEQKNKVKNYLVENNSSSVSEIQQIWRYGLNENATQEPTWLRLARPEYRKLYENATETEKNGLAETAKYLILESQRDVDLFWERSGLKWRKERQMLNESFVANAPKISMAQQSYNDLGYSKESAEMYLRLLQ